MKDLSNWEDYLYHPQFTTGTPLTVPIGCDVFGEEIFMDIDKNPHLLIGGTTGSGKSNFLKSTINYLLYRNDPDVLKFILIDPKRVELTLYNNLPHLLTPVITEPKKAVQALYWVTEEIARRYDLLEALNARNIFDYNNRVDNYADTKSGMKNSDGVISEKPEPLPYIVIVIDEFSDLISAYPREIEALIVRILHMARPAGIYIILSTSRPAVNVYTGTIRANLPSRLAFSTASKVDSRTLVDKVGAEKLRGQGHGLWRRDKTAELIEVQTPYISPEQFDVLVNGIIQRKRNIVPTDILENYTHEALIDDNDEYDEELYEEAKQAVIEAGQATATRLQRILKIGYTRANRLIDMLEERGVIGSADGVKPREILSKKDIDVQDTSSRDLLKKLCLVVLDNRDQIIDIQEKIQAGPGKLRNLFKKFDYATEYEKLLAVHEKMNYIAKSLTRLSQDINPSDVNVKDAHKVLTAYLEAVIETIIALEKNTAGLANIAKGFRNRTYTLSEHNKDRETINEKTEKYASISAELERLYRDL